MRCYTTTKQGNTLTKKAAKHTRSHVKSRIAIDDSYLHMLAYTVFAGENQRLTKANNSTINKTALFAVRRQVQRIRGNIEYRGHKHSAECFEPFTHNNTITTVYIEWVR